MRRERLCPHWRRPILKTIPSADYRPQLGWCPSRLGGVRRCEEGIGENGAACRAEAVVIDFEDLEVEVLAEEGYDGVNGASTESVVAEVDLN